MRLTNPWVLLLGALASTAVACGPGPRMVPPGDVAENSRVLVVADRKNATGAFVDESFSLGNFRVTDVSRKWDKTSSHKIGGYSANQTKTGYSFQLKARSPWQGSCASVNKEKAVGAFSQGESELLCECHQAETVVEARLSGSDEKQHVRGRVKLGERSLDVRAIDKTDKTNLTGLPAGYRVDDGTRPVGAVEILHPGQVWLGNDLDEHEAEALSCVFAGWMLYRPPSDM